VMANQRRSRRRLMALQERLALEATPAQHEPAQDGEEMLVREALRSLTPRDREVLLLAEWEGLSPAQIAGVLGCLTVTARGRLHRARRRFRAVFEELRARETGEQPQREGLGTEQDFNGRRPARAARPSRVAHVREGGS
jgi:RNA polymerase sigma-70 factor, ECF subfamily